MRESERETLLGNIVHNGGSCTRTGASPYGGERYSVHIHTEPVVVVLLWKSTQW